MWWHSIHYLPRGFWLHGVPRLMLLGRIRGHRPVVDGYGPRKPGLDARGRRAVARAAV
ncbi:hypothetical protein [Nonomuraea rosea]|uniref:hypothetical protein n=1 Tax=Nonomuraea rosea TaxID=638574 RepID=UPI0031E73B90